MAISCVQCKSFFIDQNGSPTRTAFATYAVVMGIFIVLMGSGGLTPCSKVIVGFSFLEAHVIAALVYVCCKKEPVREERRLSIKPFFPDPVPTVAEVPTPSSAKSEGGWDPHIVHHRSARFSDVYPHFPALHRSRSEPHDLHIKPVSNESQLSRRQLLRAFGKNSSEIRRLPELEIPGERLNHLIFHANELSHSFMRGNIQHPHLHGVKIEIFAIKYRQREQPHGPYYTLTFYQQHWVANDPPDAQWYCLGDSVTLFNHHPHVPFTRPIPLYNPPTFTLLRALIAGRHPIFCLA